MLFPGSLFKKRYRPKIAVSRYVDRVQYMRAAGERERLPLGVPVFFTVASVELGNTTTKCVLTATDLTAGCTYILEKTVRLTRSIRDPLPSERVFGRTVWGKGLTVSAVKEFVADTLLESFLSARIDRKRDLHFVVRSTGVTASFAFPEEVGAMIQALAEGCLLAGISPSKMVAPLSKDAVPEELRPYSKLDLAPFDGSVAGCLPPKTPSEIAANEMEAELSTAGIKVGAKWIGVDFRNPVITLDFGTTLKGRVTDDALPYANTIASICGLGGAVADALTQGSKLVDSEQGSALEAVGQSALTQKGTWEAAEEFAEEAFNQLRISKVPQNTMRFGTVPVDTAAAEKAGVRLLGCDIGENGSNINPLRKLGAEVQRDRGRETLFQMLDIVMARIACEIVKIALEDGLINQNISIGVTGRAGITGDKPMLFLKYIDELGFLPKEFPVEDRIVFVEDGLALGAGAMARCMFGLGTPESPLGGRRGGSCVLGMRSKAKSRKGFLDSYYKLTSHGVAE